MPERYQPNLLLAVLWASQANSMPALHWSLAFLLLPEQAAARQKILTELADAVQQQQRVNMQVPAGQQTDLVQQQQQQQQVIAGVDAATAAAMIKLAMDKNSYVARCVAEAVRLRLHSIAIRYVAVQDLVLPRTPVVSSTATEDAAQISAESANRGKMQQQQQQQCYKVPSGSVLCICPIESHHDSRLFPGDPWGFDPDRPGVQGLQPGTVVPSLAGMGYGGGFWR
jgi:cytochrome P450